MMDKSLWETSGHWDKFSEMMFRTEAKEDKIYAIKPMNCPGAVEIFKQGLKSYRDLPFLLAEFTKIALLTVLAKKLLKLRKFI